MQTHQNVFAFCFFKCNPKYLIYPERNSVQNYGRIKSNFFLDTFQPLAAWKRIKMIKVENR